jgi:isoamylase
VEGATNDPAILALRKRQVRNLLACLMLSQGVPMLLAGDEFFRTQKGNNNGYCQDNDLSWVDWSLCERHADLLAFTKQLISFRKAHPSLRRRSFLKGNLPESGGADITWIGIDGQEPAWDHAAAVGCLLNGGREFTGADEDKDHLLLLFNGQDHPVTFHLPDPPEVPWQVRWSTEEQEPAPADEGTRMTIDGRSVCVLASPDPGTD